MRQSPWMVCFIVVAMTAVAQEKFGPPEYEKANIDGLNGIMVVPSVQNARGEWDPVRLDDCWVYLAPGDALQEHLSFQCNEWFLPPADGSYLVWMATDDCVSSFQTILMNRNEPYRGGSVLIHEMQAAGFVTIDSTVPPDHTLRFQHLDVPWGWFALRVSSEDAGGRFAMPPGRVFAGIFNSREEAVAHSRPMHVDAGKVTNFHLATPDRGSDLLVILGKPRGHRDGQSVDVVLSGAEQRTPDVFLDQRNRVVALWYGLQNDRVTVSASSPDLELKRELQLRPRMISTLRTELTVKEERNEENPP